MQTYIKFLNYATLTAICFFKWSSVFLKTVFSRLSFKNKMTIQACGKQHSTMLITHLFHKVINMFVPLFVNKLQSYPQSRSISLHNSEELSTFPFNFAQKK